MRKLSISFALTTLLMLGGAHVALAGPVLVDPSVLQPPPPPGAMCRADGPGVICHTTFNEFLDGEPVAELGCGTVYQTSADIRVGIRWYDADLQLVRRHVFSDLEGTWSLSPTGDRPAVRIEGHSNWTDEYLIPGDEDSAIGASRGEFTVHIPGGGGLIHVGGIDIGEEHRGVLRFAEDPAAAVALCEALAG